MSREEFEALIRMHQAELYRYVCYLGADGSTAEDMTQETFLVAWEGSSVPDFEDPGRAAAWLRGVARNKFLKYCRERRTSRLVVSNEVLERSESFWQLEFLRDGDGFDYLGALRKCLTKLSEKHRRVLRMRYEDERSRSEMARSYGISENGIKVLLRRLRETLRVCIRKELRIGKPV